MVGILLMDLSKAFNTINHSLLSAKLKADSFSVNSIKCLQSNLSNRFQRTHINGSFSNGVVISAAVPQNSVLGLQLFNIFFNDYLFWLTVLVFVTILMIILITLFIFITVLMIILYTTGKNLDKLKLDL